MTLHLHSLWPAHPRQPVESGLSPLPRDPDPDSALVPGRTLAPGQTRGAPVPGPPVQTVATGETVCALKGKKS